MERQYTRLDQVRQRMDPVINGIKNEEDRRCAYVHLYGVGLLAAALALKRGFGRETAELAEVAGMLHDLLTYVDRAEDTPDHAHACADYAKKTILDPLGCFSQKEKDMMYQGIYNHSDKRVKGCAFDEIIKDADAAQHALRNPMEDFFYHMERVQQAMRDLVCP